MKTKPNSTTSDISILKYWWVVADVEVKDYDHEMKQPTLSGDGSTKEERKSVDEA